MSVLNIDVATFQDVVARRSLAVIGFAPLGTVPSGLEALARRHPEATFGQVDPQRAPGVAAMFGVAEGPALDMRAVRAEIDERKQAEAALKMRRVCPTARRCRSSEVE
jgi:hypothetical protein